MLELCGALLDQLGRDALPVGVALCELVDNQGGIRSAVTVDWEDRDLETTLGAHTVESDVRAAALAEAHFGAGKGLKNFLYLSVGTGISHTLVVEGRLYAGAQGYAILVGAPPIEVTASGAALSREAGADTRDVLADSAHRDLVGQAAETVGQAVAFLIHALDPGAVVIGGGLGANPTYFGLLTAATRGRLDPVAADVPIRAAGLGDWSGVVGAALIAEPRRDS